MLRPQSTCMYVKYKVFILCNVEFYHYVLRIQDINEEDIPPPSPSPTTKHSLTLITEALGDALTSPGRRPRSHTASEALSKQISTGKYNTVNTLYTWWVQCRAVYFFNTLVDVNTDQYHTKVGEMQAVLFCLYESVCTMDLIIII